MTPFSLIFQYIELITPCKTAKKVKKACLAHYRNDPLLELASGPGDRVMSSIYLKMGENAIIFEESEARLLYYYAKF